ncbi:MAG: hypothetical protein HXS41_11315 [Theionarchaea archaeon]|nr:hypothetical protein [Theionarchaea archaeon]MBU7000066.1 hypothetical protein [Theionarchaea archaeon]MBU7021636.1 hypothetical protein [Theionarchaea archaeon]MBU7034901.1 hypothetical protein [Theionarchaea archaeon]MBU7039377.1 hypothetical protein [Theionarchaea archaeon]
MHKRRVAFVGLLLPLLVVATGVPISCCISDPTVTVIYDVNVNMELLKLLSKEGFSYQLVEDIVPSFGATGTREFVMYRAHYGLATAMVASDMVVLKTHEEKYDWETGVKTELLFLQTIGAIGYMDIETISRVASWETTSGKNLFLIPDEVDTVVFGDNQYPAGQSVTTTYLCIKNRWLAVPGNGLVSVAGSVLTVTLLRCGGEISADTSKLSLFGPFREVVLVCNSIDFEMTGRELRTILTEKGYRVRRIDPQEFMVYRWFSPRIILLGGHESPEGMGDIVASLLTQSEKQMIENTGPYLFSIEGRDFRKQSMVILAGKDREGTHDITMDRIDDIVMWIEAYS